jgi:hypothetical protein
MRWVWVWQWGGILIGFLCIVHGVKSKLFPPWAKSDLSLFVSLPLKISLLLLYCCRWMRFFKKGLLSTHWATNRDDMMVSGLSVTCLPCFESWVRIFKGGQARPDQTHSHKLPTQLCHTWVGIESWFSNTQLFLPYDEWREEDDIPSDLPPHNHGTHPYCSYHFLCTITTSLL